MLTLIILEPAVAGKNAQKQRPAYIDWDLMHKADDPPWPKSPLTGIVQAQIASICQEHTPTVSLEPRLQRLQEVEQRAFTKRASEAAGATKTEKSLACEACNQVQNNSPQHALDNLELMAPWMEWITFLLLGQSPTNAEQHISIIGVLVLKARSGVSP